MYLLCPVPVPVLEAGNRAVNTAVVVTGDMKHGVSWEGGYWPDDHRSTYVQNVINAPGQKQGVLKEIKWGTPSDFGVIQDFAREVTFD